MLSLAIITWGPRSTVVQYGGPTANANVELAVKNESKYPKSGNPPLKIRLGGQKGIPEMKNRSCQCPKGDGKD